MSVLITKADGEVEPYNPHKLVQSLERSGAEKDAAQDIEAQVSKELYRGITTQEIYRRAFAHLREARRSAAARYSLKRAILEFGPSGFPFEAYVAELFAFDGYATKIDQIVQGACVEHEVDVVLTKGNEVTYIEAKFHNSAAFKTDLKVALYVKARMDDIVARARAHKEPPQSVKGLIVTNTKFTDKAVQFSNCGGVSILGWEEPQGDTLHDFIDRTGLYPVTALTTLARREKMALLEQKVVLCRDIPRETEALRAAGVAGHRAEAVMEEVGALCVPGRGLQ